MLYNKEHSSIVEREYLKKQIYLSWDRVMVISYLIYKDCEKKGHHIVEDREQRVVEKEWEELKKCGEYVKKGKEKTVHLTEGKVQQSGTQARDLKGTAKEKISQREVHRTFKILKKVQLDIRIKRTDTHKSITIKALLNSGATGIFINRKMVAKYRFRLQRLVLQKATY